jgi:hypothetical protein
MKNGYANKVDANHSKVVEEFRKAMPEATVFDAAGSGNGFPDLVVGWKRQNFLIEVKDPAKPPSGRKLTPAQEKLHLKWQGQIDVCHSAAEICAVIARYNKRQPNR